MRYTLFTYYDPSAFSDYGPEDWKKEQQAYVAYIGDLKEAGILRGVDRLVPPAQATTLTKETGELQVQDGPFAETKENLGGFFQIEVDTLDDAVDWAYKCPAAVRGKVEVRASAF